MLIYRFYFLINTNVSWGPTDVGPTGLRILPDFIQRLSRPPIITIASIRGRARGIGAEFVEGLDIRFGSREKMILGQPEVGAALSLGLVIT